MHAQTPQAFRVSVIQEAYHNALADSHFSGQTIAERWCDICPKKKYFWYWEMKKTENLLIPKI
jgi:hypothetical protein